MVSNNFGTRSLLHGRQFFHGPVRGVGLGMMWMSCALHLLCTLFLLLVYQFHLRSSNIRSQRLGTPALRVPVSFYSRKRRYIAWPRTMGKGRWWYQQKCLKMDHMVQAWLKMPMKVDVQIKKVLNARWPQYYWESVQRVQSWERLARQEVIFRLT